MVGTNLLLLLEIAGSLEPSEKASGSFGISTPALRMHGAVAVHVVKHNAWGEFVYVGGRKGCGYPICFPHRRPCRLFLLLSDDGR